MRVVEGGQWGGGIGEKECGAVGAGPCFLARQRLEKCVVSAGLGREYTV